MSTRTIGERAQRLIKAATGDPYGDGELVSEWAEGYAEPGYHGELVVFGNWNDNHKYVDGKWVGNTSTKADTVPSRLFDALERIGVSCEWLDEWATCAECQRAVRTEADSYSWTPSYLRANECEIVCHECAKLDVGFYVNEYVNDSDKAITWLTSAELSAAGWTQWEGDDPHSYENGWYPGQNDDPKAILSAIREETYADVVFLIDSVGQFDVRFSAWTRDEQDDDDNA